MKLVGCRVGAVGAGCLVDDGVLAMCWPGDDWVLVVKSCIRPSPKFVEFPALGSHSDT